MNTTKKIAVVLAVMMVAAAMAAPAAMGDDVGYEAVVCTHQNTFICCGPDGDFGEILQGGTSDIIGTFGLKNVGGWDATVDAAFTTQAVAGDHGLVKSDDNTVAISAHDFKLQQTGDKSTAVVGPCGSVVVAGDIDITTALVAFTATEKHAENVAVNGLYDCGEYIYDALGATVAAGDIRLTKVGAFACGSVVAVGDGDIGTNIVAFGAEKHAENVAVNGLYDCGEYIYDAAGAAVAEGDHRLTDVFAACACVDSGGCCPGGALTALLDNGNDVLIPGVVPRNGACCCCYDAKLFVPMATAAGTYLGTVQLTFGNA